MKTILHLLTTTVRKANAYWVNLAIYQISRFRQFLVQTTIASFFSFLRYCDLSSYFFFPITHPSSLLQTYPSFLYRHRHLVPFLVSLFFGSVFFLLFSIRSPSKKSRHISDIFASFRFDRGLNFIRKILFRGLLWQTGARSRNE